MLGCAGNHSELRFEMICCMLASHVLGVNAKNHRVCRKAPAVLQFLLTEEARGIPGETFCLKNYITGELEMVAD